MSFRLFSPWLFLSLLCFLLLILAKIQPSLSNPEFFQQICSHQFSCGYITAGFPFWGGGRLLGCGHPDLGLRCEKDIATMKIGDELYRVLDVRQKEQVLRLAREEYFQGLCPYNVNTTINENLFDLSPGYEMFNLFYDPCPVTYPGQPFTCNLNDANYTDGLITLPIGNIAPGCNTSVHFPVSKALLPAAKSKKRVLKEALETGFEMKWKLNPCDESCSGCGYDIIHNKITCYCQNGLVSNSTTCTTSTAAQAPKWSEDPSGTHTFVQNHLLA
ncbi:Leaf rust 10 disease-resistance locus receptor-like protein kinase [Melia azedarach]|uniref:Leaf rust 10 disease-resistance locus receptor-like protein kinase n=1 Tax=Melia azedarach TaxID=155640 RepID=A0ACC1X6V1_MELAZ|nr:Leaf rust 10 disease-resistance locus receptor-like protein kinase [Melia azedarach]